MHQNTRPYSLFLALFLLGNLGCGQKSDSNQQGSNPSQAVAVAPKVVSGEPITGSGKSLKAVVTFHDDLGPSNLAEFYMVINVPARGVDGTAACAVWCLRPTEDVYLLNDAAHKWMGPHKIGSSDVVSNTQCAINLHDTGLAEVNGNLVWTVSVDFAKPFYGPKSVFAKAINTQKLESNYSLLGTWTANAQ
jgi:hypothetical protein